MNELYPKKINNFFKKWGKNEHFWGKSAKKLFQNRGFYIQKSR